MRKQMTTPHLNDRACLLAETESDHSIRRLYSGHTDFRGSTYAKKLRFFTQKKSRLRKSENAVRLLYAKNSDLTHQSAFSLFIFCTQQRRFVEHLPWV